MTDNCFLFNGEKAVVFLLGGKGIESIGRPVSTAWVAECTLIDELSNAKKTIKRST